MPKLNWPFIGELAMRLRNRCAHGMFAECCGFVNLEQGAYIGSGKDFHVPEICGIGKDFICHSRIVTIHRSLLMGENVLFQGRWGIRSQIQMCQ